MYISTTHSLPVKDDYDDQFKDVVEANNNDLMTSAGTGIIFRPLFVYRKQQAKKQKRHQLIEQCHKFLESKHISPPYQPYYHLCKLDSILE